MGATRCPISESVDPSSEESAKEGLSQGASALGTRSERVRELPLMMLPNRLLLPAGEREDEWGPELIRP